MKIPTVVNLCVQMLRCRGRSIDSKFWDGEQNFVPDMWQVVFSHISVQCRVVYSDIDGLLDGSGYAMTLSERSLLNERIREVNNILNRLKHDVYMYKK